MKFKWHIEPTILKNCIMAKPHIDSHIEAVAQAWIVATLPKGFTFEKYVGMVDGEEKTKFLGFLKKESHPMIHVRAIKHGDHTLGISLERAEILIPFKAFLSEEELWKQIKIRIDHGMVTTKTLDPDTIQKIEKMKA